MSNSHAMAATATAEANTTTPLAASPTSAGAGTVLVVDDTRLNRVVLGGLVRRAGLDVVEAANGAEALEKVRTKPPGHFQCILMDLQMPIMDGWEATQWVRRWEASQGVQPEAGPHDEEPGMYPVCSLPCVRNDGSGCNSPSTCSCYGSETEEEQGEALVASCRQSTRGAAGLVPGEAALGMPGADALPTLRVAARATSPLPLQSAPDAPVLGVPATAMVRATEPRAGGSEAPCRNPCTKVLLSPTFLSTLCAASDCLCTWPPAPAGPGSAGAAALPQTAASVRGGARHCGGDAAPQEVEEEALGRLLERHAPSGTAPAPTAQQHHHCHCRHHHSHSASSCARHKHCYRRAATALPLPSHHPTRPGAAAVGPPSLGAAPHRLPPHAPADWTARRIPIFVCTTDPLDSPAPSHTLSPEHGPTRSYSSLAPASSRHAAAPHMGSLPHCGPAPAAPVGDPSAAKARHEEPLQATVASHLKELGADECVNKPLSYDMLCTLLARYIPTWQAPPPPFTAPPGHGGLYMRAMSGPPSGAGTTGPLLPPPLAGGGASTHADGLPHTKDADAVATHTTPVSTPAVPGRGAQLPCSEPAEALPPVVAAWVAPNDRAAPSRSPPSRSPSLAAASCGQGGAADMAGATRSSAQPPSAPHAVGATAPASLPTGAAPLSGAEADRLGDDLTTVDRQLLLVHRLALLPAPSLTAPLAAAAGLYGSGAGPGVPEPAPLSGGASEHSAAFFVGSTCAHAAAPLPPQQQQRKLTPAAAAAAAAALLLPSGAATSSLALFATPSVARGSGSRFTAAAACTQRASADVACTTHLLHLWPAPPRQRHAGDTPAWKRPPARSSADDAVRRTHTPLRVCQGQAPPAAGQSADGLGTGLAGAPAWLAWQPPMPEPRDAPALPSKRPQQGALDDSPETQAEQGWGRCQGGASPLPPQAALLAPTSPSLSPSLSLDLSCSPPSLQQHHHHYHATCASASHHQAPSPLLQSGTHQWALLSDPSTGAAAVAVCAEQQKQQSSGGGVARAASPTPASLFAAGQVGAAPPPWLPFLLGGSSALADELTLPARGGSGGAVCEGATLWDGWAVGGGVSGGRPEGTWALPPLGAPVVGRQAQVVDGVACGLLPVVGAGVDDVVRPRALGVEGCEVVEVSLQSMLSVANRAAAEAEAVSSRGGLP